MVWETLPATATLAQHAATFDFDGDDRINFLEYATLTPGDVASAGAIPVFTRNLAGTQGTLVIPYRYGAPDLLYTIERSTTLGSWAPIVTVNNATGLFQPLVPNVSLFFIINPDGILIVDDSITGQPRVFYQLRVMQQ